MSTDHKKRPEPLLVEIDTALVVFPVFRPKKENHGRQTVKAWRFSVLFGPWQKRQQAVLWLAKCINRIADGGQVAVA